MHSSTRCSRSKRLSFQMTHFTAVATKRVSMRSSNADVMKWMREHGMGNNLTQFNNYYMTQLIKIIAGPTVNRSLCSGTRCCGLPPKDTIPAVTTFDVYGGFKPLPRGPVGVPAGNYSSTASITTANGHRSYAQQICIRSAVRHRSRQLMPAPIGDSFKGGLTTGAQTIGLGRIAFTVTVTHFVLHDLRF